MKQSILPTLFCTIVLLVVLPLSLACDGDTDPDSAHLLFVDSPPTQITASAAIDVSYQVHTEGDLHHTEIRACMGHSSTCGLGGQDSFDESFAATKGSDGYTASITLDTAGPWTIVVFAHVGETPHISDAIHATVSE